MKKTRILSCFIVFTIVARLAGSVAFAEEESVDYEAAVDKVADKYIGKTVPGACVIVSDHEEVVFSKAYGYADLENRLPMDTENTVFEWGSISKTFIWVSVMQLKEEGKIDLHADIRSYLPEGFLKNLHYDKPVTMLHLMNHTAGFEEQLLDLRYFENDKELPLSEVLSAYQPEQVFSPGEVSAYSNWGAALAAFVVESVSGQSYKEYVKEHILKPLNMNDTSIGPFQDDNPGVTDTKAKGYSFSKSGFTEEPYMYLRMYPAGGMNGSAGDLLRYAQELAKAYEKDSLLFGKGAAKAELFAESHRSYGANSGLSHGFWQYADNPRILGHEGGTYGFKTQIWAEPERERAILILTNVMETEFCSEIMERIAYKEKSKGKTEVNADLNMLKGDYLPARSAFKNVGRMQGKMQIISITVTDDNRLCLRKPFGDKKQYYEQTGDNVFFCRDASPEEKILAFKVKDGKVHSMSFRLAHDYIPAAETQGKVVFAAGFGVYISMTILFLILLTVRSVSFLRNRKSRTRSRTLLCISGAMLGVSGIAGMLHWFSLYEILSGELIFIVVSGWCLCITGMLCGVYSCIKEKSLKNAVLLLAFIAQLFSAYYLGFLSTV